MKNGFALLSIRTRIIIVTFLIVIVAIMSSSSLLIKSVYEALEKEQGNRVLSIAKTVAQSETIKVEVGKPDGWKKIQPIAERIRLATDVEYIVIFDMNRIRYSHPIQDNIGTLFQGGDEGPSLGQHEYMSLAKGKKGIAIRAFVPILDMDGFEQVGVVVVGTLLPDLEHLIYDHRLDIAFSISLGGIIGLLGAWFLTNSIKRQMFNLEPIEIARLLEERESIINSIGEGIVAIDKEKRIRVLNEHAARILDVSDEAIGRKIEEVIVDSRLPIILESGKAEIHQTMILNGVMVMTNRLPIIVNGKTVGAVATFQDRTEMVQLAEELTGIRKFTDALRAQNHEYMNKLHTIAGLIQLKRCDDALESILTYAEEKESLNKLLMESIKDYTIIGLIIGKNSHARELGIELMVDKKSYLPTLPDRIRPQDLIAVIGNLLENAIESTAKTTQEKKWVYLKLDYQQEQKQLEIIVKDNGVGIPIEAKEQIFTLGYSTNAEKGRGIGLAIISQHVKDYGGTIEIESEVAKGATFIIRIPLTT